MEHEFDKVMDALLRSSPKDSGVLVGDDPKVHLDAADIAAFAENALPDKARLRYTAHFADCDSCRTVLSHLITMNAEAGADSAPSGVAATVATPAEPWYRNFFRTPQLAMAMGALVVVFAGFIGYTVFQSSFLMGEMAASNSSAPLTTEGRGPMTTEENAEYFADLASNSSSMANSNAMIARSANTAANVAVVPTRPADVGYPASNAATTSERSRDDGAKLAEASPPPPPAAVAESEMDAAGRAAQDRTLLPATKPGIVIQQQSPDEPVAGVPAQTQTGPSRRSAQGDNRVYDAQKAKRAEAAPARRTVGGKTFDRREDVWYDTDYRQQRTTNVRRNTDAYHKLDQGLRTITDQLPGTVVVVWKTRAYRVQ